MPGESRRPSIRSQSNKTKGVVARPTTVRLLPHEREWIERLRALIATDHESEVSQADVIRFCLEAAAYDFLGDES
jgi:hypothetical protein